MAIAAVVAGIYKGIKDIKKGGEETNEVKSGLIVETFTLKALTDSNLQLVAVNTEIRDTLRSVDQNVERLLETLKDSRETTRAQIEEQHRLRAATVDLVEMMRRIRT